MKLSDALKEFSDLLSVGSSALSALKDEATATSREDLIQYLEEIEAIAHRLDEIGREIERLSDPGAIAVS